MKGPSSKDSSLAVDSERPRVTTIDSTQAQKSEVSSLFSEYKDVLSLPGSVLGHTLKVRHRIDTEGRPLIRQKGRHIPVRQQPIYEEEIQKIQDH